MKTTTKETKASKSSTKAADAVKTEPVMGITLGTSVLTQSRVDKIASAFASAKGRLKAIEPEAVKQGILRSGSDWLGESVIKTDAAQAVRVAGRLERAGLISKGDADALRHYMALRNAFATLGL